MNKAMKKKCIIMCLVFLLPVFMTSCISHSSRSPEEQSLIIIDKYMTAIEQNDAITMLELYDPNTQKTTKGLINAVGNLVGLGDIYEFAAASLGLLSEQMQQDASSIATEFELEKVLGKSFSKNHGSINVLYNVTIYYEHHVSVGQVSKNFNMVRYQEDWYIRSVDEAVVVTGFTDIGLETEDDAVPPKSVPLVEPNTSEQDYDYQVIDNETVAIVKYTGDKNDVIMPYNIEGLPVTLIAMRAFSGNRDITSVVISGTVTEIGKDAFSFCESLIEVVIPESVVTIYGRAFSRCYSLEHVNIPESVRTIEWEAFSHCTALTSITIPDSVTYIGNSLFSNCTSLTDVTLGNNLEYISDHMFSGNSSLTSIDIPDSATYIGTRAFADCTSLTSVVIPSNVHTIYGGAFRNCYSLTSATFLGNAPERFTENAFDDVHPDFTIYFTEGAEGWRTPIWNGFPTQPR